jgi:hypothetical protein
MSGYTTTTTTTLIIIIIIIIIIIYDYTDNIWSYWNSNEKLKEKFGSCTRKTFHSFTKTAILGTSHIRRKVRTAV